MHISSEDLAYYAELRRKRLKTEELRTRRLRRRYEEQLKSEELSWGIPGGKSMKMPVLQLLRDAHIEVALDSERSCTGRVSGLPGFGQAVLARTSDILSLVSDGTLPLGFVGMDEYREFDDHDHAEDKPGRSLRLCGELRLGRATRRAPRGVMFCRDDDPVRSIEDMIKEFGVNGRTIPIATEYPVQTASFFFQHGLRAELIGTRGGVETLVAIGKYRFGVALVETGTTLAENGLREVATMFESNMALVANKTFLEVPGASERVEYLAKRLQDVLVTGE